MAGGKDLRQLVLTPTPQMHCANCENKIKGNLRFEKGVTAIETSVDAQTVTITYDAKKTDPKSLQSAMKKIGYTTTVVSDKPQSTAKDKKKK
ncbi:MAG: heavy-metal-associated domain-containing protein [Bacteroidales bacterium]|nr:heavy-metal-associated domain-containing protein [Bacteroidales bacterium]